MTGATAVLIELRERGAWVHLVSGRVRIEADAGSLPDDLIAVAREHRDELLDVLRHEVGAADSTNAISLIEDVFGDGCRIVREGDPLPTRLIEIEPLPAPVPRQAGELALDRRDWTGDDWLAVYLERAATLEYVAGMSRSEAETIALTELGEQWAQHEIAMAAELGIFEPKGVSL